MVSLLIIMANVHCSGHLVFLSHLGLDEIWGDPMSIAVPVVLPFGAVKIHEEPLSSDAETLLPHPPTAVCHRPVGKGNIGVSVSEETGLKVEQLTHCSFHTLG